MKLVISIVGCRLTLAQGLTAGGEGQIASSETLTWPDQLAGMESL